MFSRIFSPLIVFLFGTNVVASANQTALPEPLLILNSENCKGELPKNFRTTDDPYKTNVKSVPPRTGLAELHASGSAQFSEEGLKAILKRLGNRESIFIVDLRQESHGFINGSAVSWYGPKNWANKGKTGEYIAHDEETRLQDLLKAKKTSIYRVEKKVNDNIVKATPMETIVENVSTEEDLAKKYNIGYKRYFVSDHMAPTPEDVNQFIAFVRNLPPNTWLHFHCAAGIGRTTTFLAMYDMMRNAKSVSLDDIVQRQYLIGVINILESLPKSDWKYPEGEARTEFLKRFYDYCRNNNDNFQEKFVEVIETEKSLK